jgi:hypothetical protein
MIWERTREVQRLRHQLLEYFPAALEAFDDLDAPDVLELPQPLDKLSLNPPAELVLAVLVGGALMTCFACR